jgi:hypothetical protein
MISGYHGYRGNRGYTAVCTVRAWTVTGNREVPTVHNSTQYYGNILEMINVVWYNICTFVRSVRQYWIAV